ncbi:sperm-tail PG-rich repeat-containing protein 2-like [Periplaneta americana]|uniref:sperm-tail PG-rich repeat-containing protein 2-like n=1 Tax=Periplaneta americana TaxID=6978 RepID=UPI0037E8342D
MLTSGEERGRKEACDMFTSFLACSEMYDRGGDRFTFQGKSTTPSNICPNTYYLPEGFERTLENYAPFLSLASRIGKPDKQRLDIPGPEKYYPTFRTHRIKGGTALWYSEPRFKHKDNYEDGLDLMEDYEAQPWIIKPTSRGKIYVGRVTFDERGSAPSVPTKIDANGYKPASNGTFVKVPPDDNDQTLGPAFYNPSDKTFNTERYRGNFFSLMKGKHESLIDSGVPGPADYDVGIKKPLNAFQSYTEQLKFWKRKTCYLPRMSEIVELKTRRENLPGPGTYDLPAEDFNAPVVTQRRRGKGFLSSAKRFEATRLSETPAPWDHVDPRSAMDSLKKPGSRKITAFLKDSPRFPRLAKEDGPGPGSYAVRGMAEELLKRLPSKYSKSEKAFDSSEPRKIGFISREVEDAPSPAHYCIKEHICSKPRGNAVFKSRVSRYGHPPGKMSLVPGSADRLVRQKLYRMQQRRWIHIILLMDDDDDDDDDDAYDYGELLRVTNEPEYPEKTSMSL